MEHRVIEKQEKAYKELMSGRNIFLTGGAGVGKSFVANKFIQSKQEQGYNVVVCAPTGIAAGNVNGVTLHSMFKMPIGVILRRDIESIDIYDKQCDDVLAETDIIVIDEISMCRIDMFNYIAVSILKANRARKRHGKKVIQLVVIGDFFQLMPVITKSDAYVLKREYDDFNESGLAFHSKYWSMFKFKTIMLDEVVRQDNKTFIEKLNKLRTGERWYIDEIYELSAKQKNDGITICGLNSEVERINKAELERLDGEVVYYTSEYIGEAQVGDTNVDDVLYLKVGSRVITTINNSNDCYANGTFGTVTGLYSDAVTVALDNGVDAIIKKHDFEVYTYTLDDATHKIVREQCGTVRQFPLKLAYAITIHKSQGQTYEKANISPYCWECGQLYVAISRVKSPEGLYFNYKPDIYDTFVALNVLKFYREEVEKSNNDTDFKSYESADITNSMAVGNQKAFEELRSVMAKII